MMFTIVIMLMILVVTSTITFIIVIIVIIVLCLGSQEISLEGVSIFYTSPISLKFIFK